MSSARPLVRLILPILLGLVMLPGLAARSNAPQMGWVVDQKTTVFGAARVSFTPQAFKVYIEQLHVTMLTSSPEWQLTLYNDATKKYAVLTGPEASGLASFQRAAPGERPFMEVPLRMGTGVVNGLPAVEYVYPHHAAILGSEALAKRLIDKTEKGEKLTGKDKEAYDKVMTLNRKAYWVARDIPLPPSAAAVFGVDKRVVQALRLPLRVIQISNNGSQNVTVETEKIEHKKLAASEFAAPIGYKKADNKMSVLLGDSMGEDVGLVGSSSTDKGGLPLKKKAGR